jgi:hypothetical protein
VRDQSYEDGSRRYRERHSRIALSTRSRVQRRSIAPEITGEKVTAAQARAVARGVYPHPKIPVGYVRSENGVLVVEPAAATVVVQAFKRRDLGASLVEIQAWLAENGIERALSGVAWMLRSRMYLGEIHFGELHNLHAHEAIVKDRALFERVQRRTVSRGCQAKSERLLARLGVLRCRTCGSRMVINSDSGSYRRGDTSARRERISDRIQRRPRPLTSPRRPPATAATAHRRSSSCPPASILGSMSSRNAALRPQ